jgi:hypothetical protein
LLRRIADDDDPGATIAASAGSDTAGAGIARYIAATAAATAGVRGTRAASRGAEAA